MIGKGSLWFPVNSVCGGKVGKMGVKNFIMKRMPFCKMKAKRKYRKFWIRFFVFFVCAGACCRSFATNTIVS